jgi:surfeit locus 1 family protein
VERYRFALRPKWILSHVFVLVLIVTMINLGLWQLRRLDQRRAYNRHYTERTEAAPVPLDQLVQPTMTDAEIDAAEYRRVEVSGRYVPDQEVLIRSRSQNDAPGSWVVTPLRTADGTTILVNRGWIANEGRFDSVPDEMRAPSEPVDVVGLVRTSQQRGSFGPRDPATGTLTNLARVDVPRIQQQVPDRLDPVYLQLQTQDPADGTRPAPVEPPALDEGPHFSYAVQWFIFTTVAVVGYPLILRRRARELELEALDDGPADGSDPDGPDPDDEPGPGDPRLEPVDPSERA